MGVSLSRFSRQASVVAFFVALSLSGALQARSAAPPAPLDRIRIDNFGKVSDVLYRGAQPEGRDYADLATLGVKTIVNLRDDGEANEPALVKKAGMSFVLIPMSGYAKPS